MDDLIAFLRARLDEDEQAAKLVRQPYRLYVDTEGRISEPKRVEDLYGERDGEYEQSADGEDRMPNHIAVWSLIYDPARVLRGVEAKRRILDEHRQAMPGWCETCDIPGDYKGRPEGCTTVRLLALPYADHHDYREEWKP